MYVPQEVIVTLVVLAVFSVIMFLTNPERARLKRYYDWIGPPLGQDEMLIRSKLKPEEVDKIFLAHSKGEPIFVRLDKFKLGVWTDVEQPPRQDSDPTIPSVGTPDGSLWNRSGVAK